MDNPQTPEYRSGYVAVMGRPNVGKSTLINALLGQKIAAVSPRPQTTRRQQLGILTLESAQIVFIDTPGVHRPHHKLGEVMNDTAKEALENADVILFVADVSQPPDEEDHLLADLIATLKKPSPVILALNKSDLVAPSDLEARQAAFMQMLPGNIPVIISATRETNLGGLMEEIISRIPPGAQLFPEDQVTDLYEREIAADLIREAALIHLREEVPHGISVRIDEYTERDETGAYIAATIFVEKESHKPILIGQGGVMLKKIGSAARLQIEKMSGRKVFLELRVKVQKNWRDDEKTLYNFGFKKP
jgi:GTP-binding protein Era